jgi:type I restriction enzyme S subunit
MSGRDQSRTYSRKDSIVFLKTDEPFGGLSNMAGGYPIHVDGVRILTSEALYQACRFPHLPDVQKLIIGQISPMTAKMRSKPYRKDSRPDWDQVRVRIMRWSLRMKLANNWNAFSTLLLKTGERPIVEESRKDDFWGAKVVDDGDTLIGMNVLGRLLMELREQVKQQGRDAALDIAPPDIPQFLLFGRAIEVAVGLPTPQTAEAQEQGSLFGADTAIAVEAVADPAPVVPAKTVNQAFRASGLPWVPKVPEGWQVLRNGRLFGHRVETGFPDLPILEVSLRTGVRVRDMENLKRKQVMSQKEKYKRAAKGDIAYNMMRMWQGAVGPVPVDGLVSPAYVVVKPYDEANSSYYSNLFRTTAYMQEVNKFSRGIVADRNRLYWESFKQMPSLVPPRPEQDQIVAYLRAQDAHIACFIKAKRDLIKLLTEQKLRIIDHAVTRGLDATVTLKASGIEWLGEVPEHWEVSKVKLLADYINGFPFKPAEWGAKGRPIIRIQNLTKEHAAFNYYDGAIPERNHVKDGDILLSWSASLGVFVWNRGDAWLNQHIFKVVPDPKRITRGYFVWLARWFLNHMEAEAHGSTMQHITKPKFGSFPVPLPSLSEQVEIEAHINRETQDIDLAIARTEEEIKLIREYRDRLIADVVTGQVDVRGWQPGPEDVVDDAALAALGDDQDDVTEEEEDGDGED